MKIEYRPEIDGLRAISVIAVILYHLEIFTNNTNLFKGGFVGVDIFFVISGFLITSIIYKEIILTNNISILKFYERRVRRIAPVLLTVSATYLLLSYIYSLPTPFWKAAESILASTFFLANFYFFHENIGYGENYSNLLPFLHTWSLSIEEQFYIIFPIIFYCLNKYLKKYVIHILIIALIFSLIANDLGRKTHIVEINTLSFYMFPTRAWEILSGCVLAILEIKVKKKKLYLPKIVPLISFLIILYSIFFFTFDETKPVPHLILPVIATLGIIWYSRKNELITKLLSTQFLVKIGLISFSLYLWHYSIFAIFRQTDINSIYFTSPLYKILLLILTFLLSFASYKFIEKPFRNKNIISNNLLVKFLSLSIAFTVIFSIAAINQKGFKNRFIEFYNKYEHFEIDNRYLKQQFVKPLKSFYSKSAKTFSDLDNKKILFVGNSHAVGYFNSFNLNKKLFKNYEFSLLRISLNDLKKYKEKLNEFKKSEYVIIGTRYDFKLIENNSSEKLENFVDEWDSFIKLNNKKLIVFLNKPEFPSNSSNNYTVLDQKIYEKIKNKNINLDKFKETISKKYYDLQQKEVINFNNKLKKILIQRKIKYLDPFDYSCNNYNKSCDVLTNNNHKIYWDYAHYTIDGAKFFGEKISKSNWFDILDH